MTSPALPNQGSSLAHVVIADLAPLSAPVTKRAFGFRGLVFLDDVGLLDWPLDQKVAVATLAATYRVRSPHVVITVDIRGKNTHENHGVITGALACTLMGPTVALHARRLVAVGILFIGFTTCVAVADAAAVISPTHAAVATSDNGVEPKADEVVVGAYIENIQTLDLATNSFMADIYVWMRWMNPDLAPYESLEVMNPYEMWALTAIPLTEEPVPQPDGSLYFAIRYQGAFNTSFDLAQFPFGEQTLRIQLEDQRLEAAQLT